MNEETINQVYELIKKANEQQTKSITESNKRQIDSLKEEIKSNFVELHQKVDQANEQIEVLKNKNIILERQNRKNNVIIYNLEVNEEKLIEDTLLKLNSILKDFKVVESDIDNIYIIGDKNKDKPALLIKFISYLKKSLLFTEASILKENGININNDLCYEDRCERKYLVRHLKIARNQKLEAKIKGNKLVIGKQMYTVKDLQKLEDEEGEYYQETDGEEEVGDGESQRKLHEKKQTCGTSSTRNKGKDTKTYYNPKNIQTTTGGKRATRKAVKN